MHARARPCTLVGEPGWVPAALPSIHRVMYRGRSQESINHLRTPAVGAGKVGYSWETGIPACPPSTAWYPGCNTPVQDPPFPHWHHLRMARPRHRQGPPDWHRAGNGCAHQHVGSTAVPASRQGWSRLPPLAVWGFAAFWDCLCPPQPHVLAWRRGEGAEGLEGVS